MRSHSAQGEGGLRIFNDFLHILHINSTDLLAGVHTVFVFVTPIDIICLLVDSSTSFYYLSRQGGCWPHFNRGRAGPLRRKREESGGKGMGKEGRARPGSDTTLSALHGMALYCSHQFRFVFRCDVY